MSKKHILIFITIILGFCFLPEANGIVRIVDVTVTKAGQDLQADVSGMFMFPGMVFGFPDNFTRFPVPPDANNIEIQEGLDPVPWTWSPMEYQTLYLPEEPNWPMIQWELVYFPGPEYPITITYHVQYEHKLVKRDGKFVFFYADESFELFMVDPDTYPHGLFSAMGPTWPVPMDFTVSFPSDCSIEGVWSRDVPMAYQINGNQLTFSADAEHADRITVVIKPPCAYRLAGDLNDDCVVDFMDLKVLCEQWLQPPGLPSADIWPAGGDNTVNFQDLAIMANNWLIDCYEDPANPACVPKN
jgi:hypothetical protein